MATDYMSWSFSELSSCKQQSASEGPDLPISEILDHGSISFGRYATESLAWEKRSVFSHNRCQEELEKFKAPGLVAQKKAYFEEYYKKIRAMKALQAEQQETAQPSSHQDANSNSVQVVSNVNLVVSQEEKKPINVSNNPISDNDMISNLNSSLGGTVDESEQVAEKGESCRNGCNDKCSMEDNRNLPFPSSVKKASPLQIPSSHGSKSAQRSSRVSNTVINNANQLKNRASVQQAKGTVASIISKTNLDTSRSTTNNVKQLAKPNPNPTLHRKSIYKDDISRLTSNNIDRKAASISKRKLTEVRSSSAVLNSSLARDKLASSLSFTRARQVTTNTTSKSLAEKIPTRSLVHAQSAKLVSSSTIRACQVKTNTTSQGLLEKLPTMLSVHSPPAKSISEKTTIASSLRNTTLSKRLVDLSMKKKSNQKIGVDSGQRNYVKKEGKGKLSAALGREPKAALSAGLKKDSNAALAIAPMAALSGRLRKDLDAVLAREPTAALSARLRKDLDAALAREPTAALSARVKKGSNTALAKGPKAAFSVTLRKDSNAALGKEPTAASSARPRTGSKRASSTVSNVPKAFTQKIVPCRSPDLVHDPREPTQPRSRPIWR